MTKFNLIAFVLNVPIAVEYCDDCGCCVPADLLKTINDGSNICESCLNTDDYIICADCGDYAHIDAAYYCDDYGEYICEYCHDAGDYYYCDDCGTLHYIDNIIITGAGVPICTNCITDDYFCCDDCGEYYKKENGYYIEDGGYYVCEDCFCDNGYFYCDDCGCYYSEDCFGRIDENSGYVYCCDCDDGAVDPDNVHSLDGCLYSYHGAGNYFNYTDYEDCGYGVELEVIAGPNFNINTFKDFILDNNIYSPINAAEPDTAIFKAEKDGSVDAEFVSKVLKLPDLIDALKYITDGLKSAGCLSHEYKGSDGSSCGLHINISTALFNNAAHVRRFIYFIHLNKNLFKILSRRTNAQINRWARFLDVDAAAGPAAVCGAYEVAHKKAVNVRSYSIEAADSIELRINRGTLNFNTLKATLNLIDLLILFTADGGNNSGRDFISYAVEAADDDAAAAIKQYLKERAGYVPDLLKYIPADVVE